MKEFKSYKDLKILLEVNKEVRDSYIELREMLFKNTVKGPSGISPIELGEIGSNNQYTMEVYMNQLDKIDKQLLASNKIINQISNTIARVDKRLAELKGLDYKVVYLRDVEGYTLSEIANRLGYSERHIKRISANNR